MMGNKVEINFPPVRIISLVPSQTELLFDLGLDEEVVGITKFCIHPESWFRSKTRVGGTKTVNLDRIKELQPDLIIANKEENTREEIEYLSTIYPVWISDIATVDDALVMIREVGKITNRQAQASVIIDEINKGFLGFEIQSKPKRVAYFIWRNPWMCAGGGTFINNLIEKAGWTNVLADISRYPEIDLQLLKDRSVDTILLSSEPYPFKDEHIAEIRTQLPGVKVLIVDGEMFSWYGSRLRFSANYIKSLMASI